MAILNSPEDVRRALGISDKEHRVTTYLRAQMEDKGLEGSLAGVLVNAVGTINYYKIDCDVRPDVGSRKSNWSIGMTFPNLKGVWSPRDLDRIASYKEGYFVPGTEFGVDGYVALINMISTELGSEVPENAVRFP